MDRGKTRLSMTSQGIRHGSWSLNFLVTTLIFPIFSHLPQLPIALETLSNVHNIYIYDSKLSWFSQYLYLRPKLVLNCSCVSVSAIGQRSALVICPCVRERHVLLVVPLVVKSSLICWNWHCWRWHAGRQVSLAIKLMSVLRAVLWRPPAAWRKWRGAACKVILYRRDGRKRAFCKIWNKMNGNISPNNAVFKCHYLATGNCDVSTQKKRPTPSARATIHRNMRTHAQS